MIDSLKSKNIDMCELTLHVGAGTFLPVKCASAKDHTMHIEHFEIDIDTLKKIAAHASKVIAVGTTSVRTMESLSVLGYRVIKDGEIDEDRAVGQWEAYDIPPEMGGSELLQGLISAMESRGMTRLHSSTGIMIVPMYDFKVVGRLITNFHQPQSTLLLLIKAVVGERWRDIYEYALDSEFRFLSYGDSSLLDVNRSR